MPYEWDEAKRRGNIAKHGIDFESARRFDWATASFERSMRHDDPHRPPLIAPRHRPYPPIPRVAQIHASSVSSNCAAHSRRPCPAPGYVTRRFGPDAQP